jgi:hypothetical protein
MKRLYLTKQANNDLWHYIGEPLHPNTTLDTGLINVPDKSEIRIDGFGAYVEREFI